MKTSENKVLKLQHEGVETDLTDLIPFVPYFGILVKVKPSLGRCERFVNIRKVKNSWTLSCDAGSRSHTRSHGAHPQITMDAFDRVTSVDLFSKK